MKVTLEVGTMNASKSSQIILSAYNLEKNQGKKIIAFKPETDSRDGAFVVSRAISDKLPAIVVPKDDEGEVIYTYIANSNPYVVFVDELQFFTPKQVEALATASILFDVEIRCYGLMISFLGEMFEPIKKALECGFRLSYIDMECDYCKEKATHHLLFNNGEVVKDGSPIVVEDKSNNEQVYKSVCYGCFNQFTNTKYNHIKKEF